MLALASMLGAECGQFSFLTFPLARGRCGGGGESLRMAVDVGLKNFKKLFVADSLCEGSIIFKTGRIMDDCCILANWELRRILQFASGPNSSGVSYRSS